jgi:hypothetical protein
MEFSEDIRLVRMDCAKVQLLSIAIEGTIQALEKWPLHRDYSYGIGLHAILGVPFLTIDAINRFVERYLASESAYRVPQSCNYTLSTSSAGGWN